MRRTVVTDSGLYYDHLLSVINSVIDVISHGGLAAVCGSPFFCAVTKLGRGAHVNYVISLERICVALRSTSCYVILKINMYARTIIH